MFKMIFLLFGLAVGFGGGVYWAHHNPEAAAKLSAEEEKKFLEAQLAITQKIQSKLEQIQGKVSAPKGASGFVGGGQGPAVNPAEVNDLKADAQRQEEELQRRIAQIK
ncbi:MAG TPA: hypothetical protein VER17_07220 [Tepidisphaeraceae bacterium]|nr:hypothetical protein [Tepidisphaeraceae bacterium]